MLKKLSFGLALTAAFGLMACSDSSSGSDGGKVTISCKVLKEKPLTIKESEGPFSATITYDLNKDGNPVATYEFSSDAIAKDECEDMGKDNEYGDVTCTGKKIVAVYNEVASEKEFQEFLDAMKEDCIESDGMTVNLDEDNVIDLDGDEDGDDDGEDGDEGPATESSCDFDVNADVWEYSFEYEDEVDKSKGSVRYEFDGKDYTVVRTTKNTSKDADLACTEEAAASYNDEYNTTNMSKKTEASCEGKALVLKTTDVYRDYEEEFGFTKQSLVATVTASCRAGY